MNPLSVIRLEPDGPDNAGLIRDELDPDDFQSPLPVQSTYAYYDDEGAGLYVGVWETGTMQEKFQPYGMDEFMWIIQGRVVMVEPDDKETIVDAGEAFVIPRGYPCSWKQEGYLKKFYMIYENPDGSMPEAPTVSGIIKPRVDAKLEVVDAGSLFVYKGEAPTWKNHTYYQDTTGQMLVGTFKITPFMSETSPYSCSEMICLLEGSVTITDGEGFGHFFKAGDTFFIPKGTVCSWEVHEVIRGFYSIFRPAH
jgi:uncharacterized cupin superfamily protein